MSAELRGLTLFIVCDEKKCTNERAVATGASAQLLSLEKATEAATRVGWVHEGKRTVCRECILKMLKINQKQPTKNNRK